MVERLDARRGMSVECLLSTCIPRDLRACTIVSSDRWHILLVVAVVVFISLLIAIDEVFVGVVVVWLCAVKLIVVCRALYDLKVMWQMTCVASICCSRSLFSIRPSMSCTNGAPLGCVWICVRVAGYPGGIRAYKASAQKLLTASAAGANPFEGMIPSIPEGHKLHFGDAEYFKFEEGGLAALQDVGFVLVAGGLLLPTAPSPSARPLQRASTHNRTYTVSRAHPQVLHFETGTINVAHYWNLTSRSR